jgi:hypothetical protein
LVLLEKQANEIQDEIALLQGTDDAELYEIITRNETLKREAFPTIKKVKEEGGEVKEKKEKKLPTYVRPPNYAVSYLPKNIILVAKLMGTEMKLKFDGKQFINQTTKEVYETLRKATIAHQLATGAKSIPDAWTHFKTADGKSIARLDITPL